MNRSFLSQLLKLSSKLKYILPLFVLAMFLLPESWVLTIYLSALPAVILACLGIGVFFVLKRNWVLAISYDLAAVFCIGYILITIPRTAEPNLSTDRTPHPKIAFANVLSFNSEKADAVKAILAQKADFVGIAEWAKDWRPYTAKLREQYPYHYEYHAPHNLGIAFYSKYPAKVKRHYWFEVSTLEVTVQFPDKQETVWVLHAENPLIPKNYPVRNGQMANIAKRISAKKAVEPVTIVGDFNCVSWDPAFVRFIKETGLRSLSPLQRTWSSRIFPWAVIPIDHALSTSNAHLYSNTFEVPGSDHRGLVMYY